MPTALELDREHWQSYLKAASRRSHSSQLSQEERIERRQLILRIHKAAAFLKRQFGVTRVILFGSLAHDAWFTAHSDVDLAVEGLDAAAFWQAWKQVEEIVESHPVDLVEMEYASDALKRAIKRHGVDL